MARELQAWYQHAACRLVESRALLGDHTRWAVRQAVHDLYFSTLDPERCHDHRREGFRIADEHRYVHFSWARTRLEALLRGELLPEEKLGKEDERDPSRTDAAGTAGGNT